jgi:hypothetical protein
MKDKIVTFGEIMLRLSPENNARFTQCNAFEAVYGGGEANTAVSLANFDVDANYVTKLPKHHITLPANHLPMLPHLIIICIPTLPKSLTQ